MFYDCPDYPAGHMGGVLDLPSLLVGIQAGSEKVVLVLSCIQPLGHSRDDLSEEAGPETASTPVTLYEVR